MTLSIVYSEVNLLCILILLLICFKLRSETYTQSSRRLLLLVLLSNCFFFALDAVWIFIDNRTLAVGIAANRALNTLYYITSGAVSLFWFLYSESIQGSRLVRDRRSVLLCSLPVLVLAVLTLISLKTGWLFYIDNANVYHRGPLYALQLMLSYGYVIFTAVKALVLSVCAASYYKKIEYRTLALFVVPTLLAGGIQVLIPGISLLCVGTTVGILFVFLTMQEHMIFTDKLTGLNNRSRMTQYLSERMAHKDEGSRLYVVMMDLDYFKQINDRYGHVEGDRALCRAADALRGCCNDRRCLIARYGGDEFAAVCELGEGEDISGFCRSVRDAIVECNRGGDYVLTLSLGYAEYLPGIDTDLDLIRLADAELYRAKQAR